MAEGGPSALETQKTEITRLLRHVLRKGDSWFLVDVHWFKQWKKYVGFDSWDTLNAGSETYHPGQIDNSTLLKDTTSSGAGTQLKEHLVDELDYVLVPAEAWEKLVAWYGIVQGQEPIKRQVIEQGMFVKHCKVEVYLLDLKLSENSDLNTVITQQFSRASTIEMLEHEMRQVFWIDEKREVRLWNRYMSNTYEQLSKKEHTLQDAGLYQGQVIVIEQKNYDGTWPRHAKNTSTYNSNNTYSTRSGYGSTSVAASSSYNSYDTGFYGSSSSSSSYYNNCDKGNGPKPGLCGLGNMGNTCFMNSALQCMSNVPGLTMYMLSGRWEKELNKENPLGMNGEIAVSFAQLIHEIWSGQRSYTVPRNFKVALGRFAPQFSGYQQQDSQELMAFLLDGLHEDLNRIRKKPYIELKDASGRDDAVVAKEAWDNYKKRNDSVIVDTFHALLKSTVECPDCQKISVTFDPFCYLSLPLPIKKERQMEVFWVSASPSDKLVQFKLTVPKQGSILDLCKVLGSYVGVPAEQMVVTDVYNHRFHKIFALDEGLNHILDRDDIFIYEIPVIPGDGEYCQVPVYFRDLVKDSPSFSTSSSHLFGQPIILTVPVGCNYQVLYSHLLKRLSRIVRTPQRGEVWWKEEEEEEDDADSMSEDESPSTDQSKSAARSEVHHNSKADNGHKSKDVQMAPDQGAVDGSNDCEGEAASSEHGEEREVQDASVNTKLTRCTDPEVASWPVFRLSYVNTYGSSDTMPTMCNDGRPLNLNNRTYISMDWTPLAKRKFYDEKRAEMLEQHDTMRSRSGQKRMVLQLEDCLRLFTEAEKLSEQDPWFCPQCRKHQQATKKFDLWSLPHYLIIHLKRFSYNRYFRDKIDALVEFPTQGLDLRKYILNRDNRDINVYDLIAVTNHYGGLGGGHYTAFAQNKEDKEWYYFDDSNVSMSSEESVVTKAAYVLVYKRRGLDPAAETIPTKASPSSYPPDPPSSISTSNSNGEDSDLNGYTNSNSDNEMDTN